eukprot:Gb_35649 [translate_table: standard]
MKMPTLNILRTGICEDEYPCSVMCAMSIRKHEHWINLAVNASQARMVQNLKISRIMEIRSFDSSQMCSSSNSSSTSGSRLGSPVMPGGISPLSPSVVARTGMQDASFGSVGWASADSEASLSERARQTLVLLQKACQKTYMLLQKIQKKGCSYINKTQCREFLQLNRLRDALSNILGDLKKETPEVQAHCWKAVREMNRMIFITEQFVEDCFGPVVPVKVLKKVGDGVEFSLIRFQLIWCVKALRPILSEAKRECFPDLDDKDDQFLSENDKEKLEDCCLEDRKALLKNLKKQEYRMNSPESRILQFLCSLNKKHGMQRSSSSFGISQGSPGEEPNKLLEELVSTKCVFVNLTELKWEHLNPIIGHGSFGIVKSASWLGERFAVKIVQALMFLSGRGDCYMVMELAQGNLRSYIASQQHNITLESAVDIMLQIAEGMKYLHSKDMIHHGLKAENVLVQWKGLDKLLHVQYVQAKLCDFGLAGTKIEGSNSIGRSPNVGTRFWIAPELFKEITSIDDLTAGANHSVEAEVYSFAMIFCEVLAGRIPFEDVAINWTIVRDKVLNGERPELPRDCPKYLAWYIERCWDGIPNRRPSFIDICKMLRHFKGCINAIREDMVFKEVFLSWIMVEKYRMNAKAGQKYDEVLLMAAEYFANFNGLKHDFSRAFSLIHDAAERGYAEAQWKVGLFHELGLGVKRNESEAVKWYEDAKNKNDLSALVELGRFYHLERCISELLMMLNQGEDPQYVELAAERLHELTFKDGRPLVAGPNLENIQHLVNALSRNSITERGRHSVVLMLKNMAEDVEVKEEIIYSDGITAILKHLKLVSTNDIWCRDAVETLGLLFDGAGTEAIYFSVKDSIISALDECLQYNAPCFVDVLIRYLQEKVCKLWLRRNSGIVSSLMSIHSRVPGLPNDKALQIRQRLEDFGFKV